LSFKEKRIAPKKLKSSIEIAPKPTFALVITAKNDITTARRA
jgi:hypothetical protein